MKRLSLRWMLLWPILVTVSIGLVALAVYVDGTARGDRISAIDDELSRVAVRTLGAPPPRPAEAGAEPGPADDELGDVDAPVQFRIDGDGAIIELVSGANPFTPAQVDDLVDRIGNTTVDASPRYRVRVTEQRDGTRLVSALSLAEVDASMSNLRSSLALGGIVMFAIVAAIVTAIATVVTRPVTRMSRAANEIAAGALDTPIDPPSGSRETADLAVDLEQMVQRLTTSIDDANRARDTMQRFLADASHELRTPLTSLRGYSELYARNMLNEPGHLDRAMDRVGSESNRLAHMVSDMLQLASGDTASAARFEPVDLVAVARDIVDDLTASHPDHRIALHASGDHLVDAAALVDGDPQRLHQCVLNLVSNACQHGGDRVEVRVEAIPAANDGSGTGQRAVTVAVVDHGEGIDDDTAEQIFLPFYRGDDSRTRNGHGGAGLGLALAEQIAEQHGGQIEVEPTPGGGATFVLTVPVASPAI